MKHIVTLIVLFFVCLSLGCQKERIEDVDTIILSLKIHMMNLEKIFESPDFFIRMDFNDSQLLNQNIVLAIQKEETFIKSELNKIINDTEFLKKINSDKTFHEVNIETNTLMATPCYDAYENQIASVRNAYLGCMLVAGVTANAPGMAGCTIGMAIGSLTAKNNFNSCMERNYGPQ